MDSKIVLFIFLLCFGVDAIAQDYSWKSEPVDGHMTGCRSATVEDASLALGTFREDGTYVAPSGKEFAPSSSTAAVARVVMDAQPKMARVKTVIGHSAEEMPNYKKENKLSRWFVELVMDDVSSMAGKKVDVGICNFGGIRVGMPKGDIILDDILSMFPFKNNLVYLELKGHQLRKVFESMAADKFQAVGGAEILVENKSLVSVMVGGEPLDDNRIYGVATVSFLLYGGDGLTLADGAENMVISDYIIVDMVLEHIAELTAAGKSLEGSDKRCVTIK